jgi:hypothetical protein
LIAVGLLDVRRLLAAEQAVEGATAGGEQRRADERRKNEG